MRWSASKGDCCVSVDVISGALPKANLLPVSGRIVLVQIVPREKRHEGCDVFITEHSLPDPGRVARMLGKISYVAGCKKTHLLRKIWPSAHHTAKGGQCYAGASDRKKIGRRFYCDVCVADLETPINCHGTDCIVLLIQRYTSEVAVAVDMTDTCTI
jgi:hypothetical protein